MSNRAGYANRAHEGEPLMQPSTLNAVVAFIQPFQIDAVLEAVRRIPNFPGMSVAEVHGYGSHAAGPPHDGDRTEVHPFEKRLRIEIYCRPAEVVTIIEAIRGAAHTGHEGDGKVFALPVTLACRVRSGEWGENAILPAREP